MAPEHMKTCSNSLARGGKQIKTMRWHFSTIRCLKTGKAPASIVIISKEEKTVRKGTRVAHNSLILYNVSLFTRSICCSGNQISYINLMKSHHGLIYMIKKGFRVQVTLRLQGLKKKDLEQWFSTGFSNCPVVDIWQCQRHFWLLQGAGSTGTA